jgi:prepilin peptidase CpaA
MQTALFSLAASIFAASAYTDLRWRRIDNRLVLAMAILGAVRAVLIASPQTALFSALGALLVGTLLLPLFLRGWIGGGDLKLIAASCWFFGIGSTPSFLLAVTLCGGAISLITLGARFVRASTAPAASRGSATAEATLPYALAIAGGGWWTILALLLYR